MICEDWQHAVKFVKRMMCIDLTFLVNGFSPVYLFVTWEEKFNI